MSDERIHVLRDILLELHHGAFPESVQERFDATFAGVSAIEISLMEHELMNSDAGVTFEDVMELCDVHANLFKNAVQGVEVADTDHPGHPVQIFKQENLALRAAMMRVRRLLDNYETTEDPEMIQEIHKGLLRQLGLVGQFDRHYRRKEELMFPIMEKYGHDSPPKVMWGVDDQIRDLFAKALDVAKELPNSAISEVKEGFEAFAQEFEGMIFKEESILLMILLEAFTQVVDQVPNAKLVVAGAFFFNSNIKSPFEQKLHDLASQPQIKERIIFTGFVDYNDMPALYEMADVCVLPSIWDDPAPLAVIESLVSGKPLITTRSGGIPEYANDDCAIILERDNQLVDYLAQAMVELANDSQKRASVSSSTSGLRLQLNSRTYIGQLSELMA